MTHDDVHVHVDLLELSNPRVQVEGPRPRGLFGNSSGLDSGLESPPRDTHPQYSTGPELAWGLSRGPSPGGAPGVR